MKRSLFAAAFAAAALAAGAAWAAPVNWTINGAFNDGGTISGTYTYDVNTNTYSAVNITTTPGASFGGAAYTAPHPIASASVVAALTGSTAVGAPLLSVVLSAPMTNAGGTINLNPTISEGTCSVAGCGAGLGLRSIVSGTTSAAAPATVPTMSEWAMILFGTLLAGGAGLFVQRRRLTA